MLFRLLRQFLRPYALLLWIVVVFQFVQAMASLYLPSLNADIIDKGVATGDTNYILSTGMLMIFVTLVQIAATITAVYFGARSAMSLGRDVRKAVFDRVAEYSEREVAQFGAPSLLTRTTNDVQQVQMLVLMGATMLVSAPILAVGGIVMAMREDLELSWLIAVAVPVLLGAVSLIIFRMIPQFQKMQRRIDRINLVLREQLTGIRVIRAFVREPFEQKRFAVANAEVTETAVKAGRLMALMFPIVMLVLNISSVAVLWFGAFRIDSGSMQVGTLIAFLSYLMQILMSVMMATFMAVMIPRAAVCAERISDVLSTTSSVHAPDNPVTTLIQHGSVEFESVSFAYPGAEEPVLRELSFRIEPGTTTAIIGSTGSGKTTLLNLMARLFDATGGAVKIDGVNVRDLDPDTLWSTMGLVPQKPYLFGGTIASNLRYGNPLASDKELWEALEIAQAAEFVRSKPLGLEEPIAQGGTNVSGGQRQRLAIARALVKQPEIFLFDDSFSALDMRTDALLRRALDEKLGHVTRVIVAQRVTSIMDADQILVLEDGVLVGIGTHRELLEECETYAEIVASQLTSEEVV